VGWVAFYLLDAESKGWCTAIKGGSEAAEEMEEAGLPFTLWGRERRTDGLETLCAAREDKTEKRPARAAPFKVTGRRLRGRN